jgi:hypothetical protein
MARVPARAGRRSETDMKTKTVANGVEDRGGKKKDLRLRRRAGSLSLRQPL